ncbi:hypothetical protein HGRIS_001703 [Hohenbuehelia grisea]|uniref:Uncharacterized protein n=1 Tax=Hohenbuehelia grisea TaxID=104357 RepID=A0ABR3JIW1_9AGAR
MKQSDDDDDALSTLSKWCSIKGVLVDPRIKLSRLPDASLTVVSGEEPIPESTTCPFWSISPNKLFFP